MPAAASEFDQVAELVRTIPVVYSCGSKRIGGARVIAFWKAMPDRDNISEAEALSRILECEHAHQHGH